MQHLPLPGPADRPARPRARAGDFCHLQQQRGFPRLQLADLGAQGGQFIKKHLVGHPGLPPYAISLRPES